MEITSKAENVAPVASAVSAERVAAKTEKVAAKATKTTGKAKKATGKKRGAPKKAAEPQVKLYIQYMGREISAEEAVAAVKATWTGAPIETLEIYVKPEDNAVYYVVNGGESGKVAL